MDVGTAEVIAPRTLQEIVRDIQALGYNEEDFRLSGVNAMQSPSPSCTRPFPGRPSASAKWSNWRTTTAGGLAPRAFHQVRGTTLWILSPGNSNRSPGSATGDEQLKRWSQYEFIQYVKQRYQVFRMMPRTMPCGGHGLPFRRRLMGHSPVGRQSTR